jgi:hypothetical protein
VFFRVFGGCKPPLQIWVSFLAFTTASGGYSGLLVVCILARVRALLVLFARNDLII